MTKSITLKQLVEKGELSQDSCDEMAKSWITNTNELYCLIRSAVRHGNDEMKTRLAQNLRISQDKLSSYAEYIKPYVSKSVVNPQQTGEHPTGCLITEEQMERINWINSLSPEEFENWRNEETKRFYREHPEYGR
jgi:hypothetical protein